MEKRAPRREMQFTGDIEEGILGLLKDHCTEPEGDIVIELDLAARVALFIFGIGGCVALSIVPWVCIGTGLVKKDKSYQSY